MLRLNWLDELVPVVLLLELLREPNSELRMLFRVVVEEEDVVDVVSASPALALWSGAPRQMSVNSSAAMRNGPEVLEDEGMVFMRSLWVFRVCGRRGLVIFASRF